MKLTSIDQCVSRVDSSAASTLSTWASRKFHRISLVTQSGVCLPTEYVGFEEVPQDYLGHAIGGV